MIPLRLPDGFLGRGVPLAQVPYIHCPECRLTVYGGTAYRSSKSCPRCGTEMSPSPRPLFRASLLDSRKRGTPAGADGTAGGRA
jgi:hypothetical protein